MGKFVEGQYFKNRGDCCDFIQVTKVLVDTGTRAELAVTWFTQMHDGWRKLCTDHFDISKNNYQKWMHYSPHGERRDSGKSKT